MTRSPQHVFLADPGSGRKLTYGDFEAQLVAGCLSHRPVLKPTDFHDALVGLAVAFLIGKDVTLYDSDITDEEFTRLGVSQEFSDRQQVAATRISNLAELIHNAFGSSPSRLSLFTSGSTGIPKCVNHRLTTLARGVKVSQRHANDVWGFAYSPTHIAGVQVFLQAFANLNPLINLFHLPREQIFQHLHAHAVTHISATPTFYRMLLPVEQPFHWVRSVTFGGERTDSSLIEKLRPVFPAARFHNVYASTEAGTVLVSDGDTFCVAPHLSGLVRIHEGQIEVHRSILGEFRSAILLEGDWYPTGDRVELLGGDPSRFRILGRDRDWLNVGGAKVDPAEVEQVLRTHPAVLDARVLGLSSSVMGTVLAAEVVVAEAALFDEPSFRQFLSARLQPFKVPRIIKQVAHIDQTRSGKLKRHGW